MIPNSIAKEFILGKNGLTHIRTGLRVLHFEAIGYSKRGGRMSVVVNADVHWHKILELIPLKKGAKLARLETREPILLERVGNFKLEEEKKAEDAERHEENRQRIIKDNNYIDGERDA